MMPLPPALCLMGPTASGKSALSLELSQHLPCEIISVDSALVYRGMDIGTAKPTLAEQAVVPHHLIDILDPSEAYSAADFRHAALAAMATITAKGKIPLLVGGTMLYYKALLEGLSPLPAANPELRTQLEAEAATLGWDALHQRLRTCDPVAAQRIHPNDPQRIMRALEVFELTQQPLSTLLLAKTPPLPYRVLQWAIAPSSKAVLHQRIETRFDAMLAAGLLEEVAALYQRGDLHLNLPSMRCVGYRQVWDYLAQRQDYAEMRFRGIVATRQLAKRQMTWLNGWSMPLTWLDAEEDPLANALTHWSNWVDNV